MPTYIAFLRAINVGKRMFAKDAIIPACEDAGCTDVETYINTGNVRVTTKLRSRAKVEAALEKAFSASAGFEVPTIVFTPKELTAVAADADELAAGTMTGCSTSRCSRTRRAPLRPRSWTAPARRASGRRCGAAPPICCSVTTTTPPS